MTATRNPNKIALNCRTTSQCSSRADERPAPNWQRWADNSITICRLTNDVHETLLLCRILERV